MKRGMSLIVKTIARWVVGFIFLYGIYTMVYGHLTPGGGFAGGVILACAYILIMLAYGRGFAFRNLDWRIARALDSVGGILFLTLGVLGMILLMDDGAFFFVNFIQRSLPGEPFHLFNAGTIPIGNLVIGIKVMGAVFVGFALLSMVRVYEFRGERVFESREEEE